MRRLSHFHFTKMFSTSGPQYGATTRRHFFWKRWGRRKPKVADTDEIVAAALNMLQLRSSCTDINPNIFSTIDAAVEVFFDKDAPFHVQFDKLMTAVVEMKGEKSKDQGKRIHEQLVVLLLSVLPTPYNHLVEQLDISELQPMQLERLRVLMHFVLGDDTVLEKFEGSETALLAWVGAKQEGGEEAILNLDTIALDKAMDVRLHVQLSELLKRLFREFDPEDTGLIALKEVKESLGRIGVDGAASAKMISDVVPDDQGMIPYKQLLRMIRNQ